MNEMAAVRSPETTELPTGTRLLLGQYRIVNQLQQGGFGITYIAVDSLDREVVIKECYPSRICERIETRVASVTPKYEPLFIAFKRQFVREAKRLAKMKHAHIVGVHQVFEENDSVYMAQDLIDGVDLFTMLERAPDRLTPDFLESALRQVLEAVRYVHGQGLLHRDIAPDNICVDSEDRVMLIDFGAACDCDLGGARTDASLPAVKDGYSPVEFYHHDAAHDCRSDLYSLGATFYHLITGEIPLSADLREEAVDAGAMDPFEPLADGEWGFDRAFLATIDRALSMDVRRRVQSAEDWLAALDSIAAGQAVHESSHESAGQPAEAVVRPIAAAVGMPAPVAEPGFEQVAARVAEPAAREVSEPVATFTATPRSPAATLGGAPQHAPAAAPADAAPTAADPELEVKLSQLVQETNQNLGSDADTAQGASRDARAREGRAAQTAAARSMQGKQWVDVYGAPIDDMTVWQTEQERDVKRRKREQRELDRQAAAAAEELAKQGEGERKSLLGGIIARFTGNPDSCPA